MASVPNFKRFTVEDFKSKDRALVKKLAFPINSFFEQVRNALNKNINFTNINQNITTFDVQVDANGVPLQTTIFKHDVVGKVKGITCIKADNLTTTSTVPTGAPWVTAVQDNQILRVSNVKGLQINNKFRLTMLVIGD